MSNEVDQLVASMKSKLQEAPAIPEEVKQQLIGDLRENNKKLIEELLEQLCSDGCTITTLMSDMEALTEQLAIAMLTRDEEEMHNLSTVIAGACTMIAGKLYAGKVQ